MFGSRRLKWAEKKLAQTQRDPHLALTDVPTEVKLTGYLAAEAGSQVSEG